MRLSQVAFANVVDTKSVTPQLHPMPLAIQCQHQIKIYFYDKDNFNCLRISEMHVTEIKKRFVADVVYIGFSELSRPFNNFFTNVEEKKN